jgi:hypothetical protein
MFFGEHLLQNSRLIALIPTAGPSRVNPGRKTPMELTERLEGTLGNGWGVLLPVQFSDLFSRSNGIDGERRLLLAVLDDAVQCYLKNMMARNRHHRLIFNETRYWLISDSRKGVFAYENLCETLGIEANALRAALERRRRVAEKACARPGSLGAY